MRFGSRSQRREADEQPAGTREVAQPAVEPHGGSERLQRLAGYFRSQDELLEEMHMQVEQEIAPLTDLLARQRQTMQRLLANLEQRLHPLNEYADSEASNLAALEERLSGEGREYVWRSFEDYLAQQRHRIDETRHRIDEQRQPFMAFSDDQRKVVEVALSRFDTDLDALEENLAEQRRVMMRLLDAMRSDSFVAVKEFLADREATMDEAVQAGVTDPAEIGGTLHQLADDLGGRAAGDEHIDEVLASTGSADERLASASPVGPRALPAAPEPPAEPEDEAQDADAERSTA